MTRPPFLPSMITRAIREFQTQTMRDRAVFDARWLAAQLPENSPLGGLIVRQAMNPATAAK